MMADIQDDNLGGEMAGQDMAALELPMDPSDTLLTTNVLPNFSTAGLGAGANPPATSVRRRTWLSRFLPEHMYEYYARQTALTAAALPSGHHRVLEVPGEFTSILPLDYRVEGDGGPSAVTGSYGYVTSLYKGVSIEDGMAYALRRVENVRAPPHVCEAAVAAWRKAAHPSVVPLRRVFSSGSALFFAHDYHPGARTLRELYLEHRGAPIPERTLWSYICQLVAGLRAVHDAGLAFRGVYAAHVLVTGHGRVRFSGAGVVDVLESDSKRPLAEAQQADLLTLGQTLLSLATRSAAASANVPLALEAVVAHYSPALHALIVLLLSKPVPVHEICRLLAPQLLAELDSAYDHADSLEGLLGREADNGRALRLLLKLGFVNERPAHEGDPSWAETGDRYLLKLFRDFVFHQTTDEGRPVLDAAHVLESLNQLDLGTPTRVLLCSRDGGSILVASYAQLRRALNAAFDDLRAAQQPGGAPSASGGIDASGRPHIFRGSRGGRGRMRGRGGLLHGTTIAHRGLGASAPGGLMGGGGGHGMGGLHAQLAGLHQGMGGGGQLGGDLPAELAAGLPAELQGLLQGLSMQHGGGMGGEDGSGMGLGHDESGAGAAPSHDGYLPSGSGDDGSPGADGSELGYGGHGSGESGAQGGDDGSGGGVGGGYYQEYVPQGVGNGSGGEYYYQQNGEGDDSGGVASGQYYDEQGNLMYEDGSLATDDGSGQQQGQQQWGTAGYREFVPTGEGDASSGASGGGGGWGAFSQPYEPSAQHPGGDGQGTAYGHAQPEGGVDGGAEGYDNEAGEGAEATPRALSQHVAAAEFVPGAGRPSSGSGSGASVEGAGDGAWDPARGNLNVTAAEFRPSWS